MKIEFELDDIFARSEGISLETQIKRDIVDQILEFYSASLKSDTRAFIIDAVMKAIQAEVQVAIPALISDLLNREYTPVKQYGVKGEPTTFAKDLHATMAAEMVYKKSHYDSDKNAFTKAMDAAISEKLNAFKKEWLREVDAKFVADAMEYARSKLAERLGVK